MEYTKHILQCDRGWCHINACVCLSECDLGPCLLFPVIDDANAMKIFECCLFKYLGYQNKLFSKLTSVETWAMFDQGIVHDKVHLQTKCIYSVQYAINKNTACTVRGQMSSCALLLTETRHTNTHAILCLRAEASDTRIQSGCGLRREDGGPTPRTGKRIRCLLLRQWVA